jgi:hypothetical protein
MGFEFKPNPVIKIVILGITLLNKIAGFEHIYVAQ